MDKFFGYFDEEISALQKNANFSPIKDYNVTT